MSNKYRLHSAHSLQEWQRWRGCDRKRAYATRQLAHFNKPKEQSVYLCAHCKQYHRATSWAFMPKKAH